MILQRKTFKLIANKDLLKKCNCIRSLYTKTLLMKCSSYYLQKWQELITPSMAHIYPPVLNTEPLDLNFSQYKGTLKTTNRFARKGRSTRTSDKSTSPTQEESNTTKEPTPKKITDVENEKIEETKETQEEEAVDILQPYRLESTVPTDDLAQTPIDTEVCIDGLENATPV